MYHSFMLTRLLGLFFSINGLAFLFNSKRAQAAAESLANTPGLAWLLGITFLLWGSFFVVVQHAFGGWPILTTLAAWFIFLMGVIRLWMPCCVSKYDGSASRGRFIFIGLLLFIWGLLMLFHGFFGANVANIVVLFSAPSA